MRQRTTMCVTGRVSFQGAVLAAVLSCVAPVHAAEPWDRVTKRFGEQATCRVINVTADACVAGKQGDGKGEFYYFRYPAAHILLRFNVSSIPAGTKVHKAALRLYSQVGFPPDNKRGLKGITKDLFLPADPDRTGPWDPAEATGVQKKKGVAWSAGGDIASVPGRKIGRMYFKNWASGSQEFYDADVTPAVQEWVDRPADNHGLVIPGDEFFNRRIWSSRARDASRRPYLEITWAGANDPRMPQAAQVRATCYSGQTFITWKEAVTGNDETSYRVYRSDKPITSENLDQAELLTQLYQGSSYLSENVMGDPKGIRQPDLSSAGVKLQADSGLCVYPVPKKQSSCYAVTVVVEGNENRRIVPGDGATRDATAEEPGIPAAFEFERYFRYVGYVMFLGRFNPADPKDAWGFDNRLSAPVFFSVARPKEFDESKKAFYPLAIYLHPFGRGYFGSWDGVFNSLSFKDPQSGELLPGGFCLGFSDAQRLIFKDKDGRLHDVGHYLESSIHGYASYTGWNSRYAPTTLSKFGLPKTFEPFGPFDEGRSVMYAQKGMVFIARWMMERSPWAATIDPQRVYAAGGSMGAIGSMYLGLHHPELITAVAEFKGRMVAMTGQSSIRLGQLFGSEQENIPTPEGVGVYDYLNMPKFVSEHAGTAFPPMWLYQGKRDTTVGWSTVPAFLSAAREARVGLAAYFDQSSHTEDDPEGKFPEMRDMETFVRNQKKPGFNLFHFRSNLSFPCFTNFSLDENPGNGDPGDGDPRGGINRFCYWDWTDVVDEPGRYEITLFLVEESPKDSATVDVTPMRLQRLVHTPGTTYGWQLVRPEDKAVPARGTIAADRHGLLTIEKLPIDRKKARLILEAAARQEPGRRR